MKFNIHHRGTWSYLLSELLIADVAQLKRHQRWGVGCGCACAVPAPVVTARAHLQLVLRRWWRLGCATSAIVLCYVRIVDCLKLCTECLQFSSVRV